MLVLVGLVTVILCLSAFGRASAGARSATAGLYSDGDVVGNWEVVFAGYGSVRAVGAGSSFTLTPAVAASPTETHSALVVSRSAYSASARYSTRVTTKQQLRVGSPPNPWETGWLVFNYTDNEHFYYLALKTNGWELGKRDPSYPGGQRFLATGTAPSATLDRANQAVIRTSGPTINVAIDGRSVANFTDSQRPYLGGSYGFYSEDARVVFDRISVKQ